MSMDEILEEFAYRLKKSDDFEVKQAANYLLDALRKKERKEREDELR